MVQDQALVASKHFLVETENKNLVDNAEGPPEAKLKSLPDQTVGNDYWWPSVGRWPNWLLAAGVKNSGVVEVWRGYRYCG